MNTGRLSQEGRIRGSEDQKDDGDQLVCMGSSLTIQLRELSQAGDLP